MAKALNPNDLAKKKKEVLPDFVFEAFNNIIAKNFNNNSSHFRQDEVVEEMIKLAQFSEPIDKKIIFDNHYLDVEDVYREEGWTVSYDSPAYCEDFPATFTFKK